MVLYTHTVEFILSRNIKLKKKMQELPVVAKETVLK